MSGSQDTHPYPQLIKIPCLIAKIPTPTPSWWKYHVWLLRYSPIVDEDIMSGCCDTLYLQLMTIPCLVAEIPSLSPFAPSWWRYHVWLLRYPPHTPSWWTYHVWLLWYPLPPVDEDTMSGSEIPSLSPFAPSWWRYHVWLLRYESYHHLMTIPCLVAKIPTPTLHLMKVPSLVAKIPPTHHLTSRQSPFRTIIYVHRMYLQSKLVHINKFPKFI